MILYFAGAKEETKSEPFSDPRVAVGEDLPLMLTFMEFKQKKLSKERLKFLKELDKDFLSTKEIWKWAVIYIKGKKISYMGRYKVSNYGNVKSVKRECECGDIRGVGSTRVVPEKILKPCMTKGYLNVNLYTGNIKSMKRVSIAKLVLSTFVGEKPTLKHEACHKDDNKLNNHVDNLYWGTSKENKEDSRRNGTMRKAKGEEHYKAKLTEEDVRKIRKLYKKDKNYSKLARKYGVEINCIKRIILRQTWKHVEEELKPAKENKNGKRKWKTVCTKEKRRNSSTRTR